MNRQESKEFLEVKNNRKKHNSEVGSPRGHLLHGQGLFSGKVWKQGTRIIPRSMQDGLLTENHLATPHTCTSQEKMRKIVYLELQYLMEGIKNFLLDFVTTSIQILVSLTEFILPG